MTDEKRKIYEKFHDLIEKGELDKAKLYLNNYFFEINKFMTGKEQEIMMEKMYSRKGMEVVSCI